MELTEKEKENFTKLVKCAEAYVRKKANVIRLLNDNTDVVAVINSKYSPKNFIDAPDAERLNLVIERFCIELQNYQAMPLAINYGAFGKSYENKIFKFVKSEYSKKNTSAIAIYQGLHEICKFDEEKKLSETLENKIGTDAKELKDKKVNSAWLRYSIGLKNVIDFLHDNGLKSLYQYFEIGKKLNLRIFKDIYYMGEALTYDFFKELGRTDLIKPDTHIRYLMKFVENLNKVPTEKETIEIFEKYCNAERRYYTDKLLWLCCSGLFYEDNIKILNMNRQYFLDFCKKTR